MCMIILYSLFFILERHIYFFYPLKRDVMKKNHRIAEKYKETKRGMLPQNTAFVFIAFACILLNPIHGHATTPKNKHQAHSRAIKKGTFCTRLNAVDALGKMSSPFTPLGVPALSVALQDRSPLVQLAALQNLCKIRHPKAAKALILFGAKHANNSKSYLGKSFAIKGKFTLCIAKMRNATLPIIKATLTNKKGSLANKKGALAKVLACRVLAHLKGSQWFLLLKKATKDGSGRVRKEATKALGFYGKHKGFEKKSVAVVSSLLKDRKPSVRLEAVRALGKMGKRGVQALIKALRKGKMDVRREAASELGKLKARRAHRALGKATSHRDKELSFRACRALKNMKRSTRRCRKMFKHYPLSKIASMYGSNSHGGLTAQSVLDPPQKQPLDGVEAEDRLTVRVHPRNKNTKQGKITGPSKLREARKKCLQKQVSSD